MCDICVLMCDTEWVVVMALKCITACDAVAYCAVCEPCEHVTVCLNDPV